MKTLERPLRKWIKASKSFGTGACVEFAREEEFILIRDSKNPGVLLRCAVDAVAALLAGAKKGEFDHLVDED